MKLLNLTNRYYFIAFGFAFTIVAIISYLIIRHVIDQEFNEKLHAEKEQFIQEFDTYENLEEILFLNIGDRITIHEIPIGESFENSSDTSMYDEYEKKLMDYRRLTFSAMHNGKNYSVTIHKSLVNNDDLVEALAEIMLLVAVLFMASLIVINLLISRKIWEPFQATLQKLAHFDLKNPKPLNLPHPKVAEFAQLNDTVNEMTEQNARDYQNLKEYTENASHEIQTPLAIIQNKSELLFQNLKGEEDLANVAQIRNAAQRLSRLKEGLATLSRIDNNQYLETELIHLENYIKTLIDNVKDLLELKRISFDMESEGSPVLNMNETLAYLLFNNLITNAIRHNLENGYLKVRITSNTISFENSGPELTIPPESLFGRFNRSGESKDSTGLGLSLVKKIADRYGMKLQYANEGQRHQLLISW